MVVLNQAQIHRYEKGSVRSSRFALNEIALFTSVQFHQNTDGKSGSEDHGAPPRLPGSS